MRSGTVRDLGTRFGLAPPRRFVLPAVLLLLAEGPNHGYRLVDELRRLRFGAVDRPTVYRALAQLERDGFVTCTGATSVGGRERRIYELTDEGSRALRAWMGIVKEERDALDRALRRYSATRTVDAVVAEAVGGSAAAWSAVAPTSELDPHIGRLRPIPDGVTHATAGAAPAARPPAPFRPPAPSPQRRRFKVVPDESAVLVEARSTVGPIAFGAVGLTGEIECTVDGDAVLLTEPPRARLAMEVSGLRSGNALYDAELHRRLDARRHPTVTVELRGCDGLGAPGQLRVTGDVCLHGVSVAMEGTVEVSFRGAGDLMVRGQQVVDIRDFDIATPTMLMLRIYPDVLVQLHVEATARPVRVDP
jgi:DNA-binding PadR family transcriptional regulator